MKTPQDRADLCASVQAAIARQLCERSERAMADFSRGEAKPAFVVAGGVAANKTVRAELTKLADKHGFRFVAPPMAYCTDNAAMIALAGLERFSLMDEAERADMTGSMATVARPRWPLDEAAAQASPVHKLSGRKGAKA